MYVYTYWLIKARIQFQAIISIELKARNQFAAASKVLFKQS